MIELERLVDADDTMLSARVARAVRESPTPCVVDRFVVWYTTRPPVHVAVLLAERAD
jgi:hypothetical protein